MFDYHVHTSFSADSQEPVESYLNELQARGITEFCVTEHMAVNFHRGNWMVDLDAYVPKIRALQAAGYPVKLGIEADVNCAACDVEELVTQLSRYPLDFVLVSSHCFMGSDPYQEDMFQNRDAIAVCRSYLQDLYTCLRRIDPALFSALAHLDYLAKGFGATYLPGGLFRYEYAPDELDAVMRYAIEHGRCIEINTSCPQSLRGDDAPVLGACAVQCNTTCDGSLLGNGVISKRLELEDGIPVFQLAAPLRHREDDVQDYAAQEIKNAIAFIEEHTGEKWDWKAYFECAERVNYATKCRLEWLEMNKTDYPQVFGSNLALYTETNYMAICGKVPAFREVDRKITQLAERAYRKQKKAANEYRHRAIVWGVQSHFYMDFLVWLLNCWGIVPLTDMLSMVSTRELATTDTPENREQAYYDMAWLTENMIMRNRTHGGYKVLLDELWEFCEQFNADMVILWEHMSCKALDGMHGLFEERAREHGIHLVWVTHDLFDPRVISRQGVRQQVNDYMRTVMQEEPVDPSLEILKDEKSW